MPLPRMQANIFALRSNASYTPTLIGFGAYEEGAAADFNMMAWSMMGAEAVSDGKGGTILPDIVSVVNAYSTYFFVGAGMKGSDAAAVVALGGAVTFGLESNWAGRPEDNAGIEGTLASALQLSQLVGAANWRVQALVYRAAYDALVKARVSAEKAVEASVYSTLSLAWSVGVDSALAQGSALLARGVSPPTVPPLLSVMRTAYANINATLGLSVLQGQEPDLGLPAWNCSLSDIPFLTHSLTAIAALPSTDAKLAAVAALVGWTQAPAGGWYDALGDIDPAAHPHLDPGQGVASDPSFYFTPLQAFTGSNNNPAVGAMRVSWRTFAQGFYDYALTLRYTTLGPGPYTLRLVYFSDGNINGDSGIPYRLTANGNYVIQDYVVPAYPMVVSTYDLPVAVTSSGSLTVACNQHPGVSGSGRSCQIAEVWLYPTP